MPLSAPAAALVGIIIPTDNEAAGIGVLLPHLRRAGTATDAAMEIIVADSTGTDAAAALARQLPRRPDNDERTGSYAAAPAAHPAAGAARPHHHLGPQVSRKRRFSASNGFYLLTELHYVGVAQPTLLRAYRAIIRQDKL